MSSATVLYVLERFMEKGIPKGDQGLLLSFGPDSLPNGFYWNGNRAKNFKSIG